jgi:cytochrome c
MRAAVLAMVLLAVPAGAAELGDPAEGARLFTRECAACHQVGDGARDRVGPHLNRVFGRRAAAHDGFNYSRSIQRMGADGLTWDLDTIDAYIENPKSLVSGTRMNYRGLRDPALRGHLIAYLRAYSDSPQNIPEAVPTARPTIPDLAPEVLAIEGDAEWGEYLSSECMTCHKRDGADEGIPSITTWPAEDFVLAMHAYKQRLRPHPVMQMMAGRLSDDEIAALAAYFEALD